MLDLTPRRFVLAAVALVLTAGIIALGMVLLTARDAARGVGEVVERAGAQVAGIAAGFSSGTITTTFLAQLPETEAAGGGRLELATSTVTETFTRSEERRIFWERFSLGETVVEIRAPVTYRYHVRLDDPWRLEVSGQTCLVHAPPIRASLPPAIHTDQLEKRANSSGWFPLDTTEQLDELQRTLTPTLAQYAVDSRHLAAVRESARETIANFVRAWLLREDHWRDDRFRAIVVRFPDDSEREVSGIRPLTIEE